MSNISRIEWTERTWNPTVGCTKVSPGCAHCYAEAMAIRLQAIGVRGYENGFCLTLMPERLDEPLRRKKPTMYFVNSMSDLFHEEVPFPYIDCVIDAIRSASQHSFQVLTKRSHRMQQYFDKKDLPRNLWLGVSVENREHGLPRLEVLRQVKAEVRFLSIEPLLEDLGAIDLQGIHWVIVGGESGRQARRMRGAWVDNIRQQCEKQGVAFFFKQWGGWGEDGKKRAKWMNGRTYQGRTWDEFPVNVRAEAGSIALTE